MTKEILVEKREGVATITINRPSKRNAITYQMWRELASIATHLEDDPSVRVVVVKGKGNDAFSAGADISDFQKYRSNSRQARVYAEAFEGALDAMEHMTKVSIAMVQGYCLGGGCELATALDLRIASDTSRFAIPVARMGILLGHREMRRLLRLVGMGNTRYLLLTARQVGASEALRMGLINTVVPQKDLEDYTYHLAQEISSKAPLSHRGHKKIWEQVLSNPSLDRLTENDISFQLANFDSEDYQEARKAFMDRRSPDFRGR